MSENEKNIWALIVRHLDNQLTDQESEELEQWLDRSNENRRTLHAADRIWKASEEKSQAHLIEELNLEDDWEKVRKKIQPQQHQKARVAKIRRLRRRQQWGSHLLKAAALILVAFTSVVLTLQYTPDPEPTADVKPVFNEIVTHSAERANVELSDGSKVHLNADSRLRMPAHFQSDKREVTLEGQAFFDVRSDKNRPFIIQAGDTEIEVIGTSFDVRSYEDDETIRIAVREGTVEFGERDTPGSRMVVNGGYMGTFSRATGDLSVEMYDDPDLYFAWMEGRLIFRNTPLTEVFAQIERWFDVEVRSEIDRDSLAKMNFSADLKTRAVEDVMEVLEMSMNIGTEKEGNQILITHSNTHGTRN
jgi:transmembrane sensor